MEYWKGCIGAHEASRAALQAFDLDTSSANLSRTSLLAKTLSPSLKMDWSYGNVDEHLREPNLHSLTFGESTSGMASPLVASNLETRVDHHLWANIDPKPGTLKGRIAPAVGMSDAIPGSRRELVATR